MGAKTNFENIVKKDIILFLANICLTPPFSTVGKVPPKE